MKNKKTIFHPVKYIGALLFLMAFTLNIQTSLNGEWELVNVGFAQGSGGSGGSGGSTCNDVCKTDEFRVCSIKATDTNGNPITVLCHYMTKK